MRHFHSLAVQDDIWSCDHITTNELACCQGELWKGSFSWLVKSALAESCLHQIVPVTSSCQIWLILSGYIYLSLNYFSAWYTFFRVRIMINCPHTTNKHWRPAISISQELLSRWSRISHLLLSILARPFVMCPILRPHVLHTLYLTCRETLHTIVVGVVHIIMDWVNNSFASTGVATLFNC